MASTAVALYLLDLDRETQLILRGLLAHQGNTPEDIHLIVHVETEHLTYVLLEGFKWLKITPMKYGATVMREAEG